jgi:hypothetical protein
MDKIKIRLVALMFSAVFGLHGSYSAAYTIPERLEFDLTWIGIKAGTAVLEVKEEEEGLRIISTANSADWVSFFYKVRDRVESLLKSASPPGLGSDPTIHSEEGRADPVKEGVYDPSGKGVYDPIKEGVYDPQPVNYRLRTREGKHRKDKEVIFDRNGGKAIYINHLKPEKKEFDVPAVIYDPLSAFYQVRNMDLEVGSSVYVPVFDSKKVWNVEVKVLKRERVKVPMGTFDTLKIKPLMKSEGIFSRKGEIYIWVTDDDKKMPVKLNSKVAVGSINAVLVGGSY